MKTKNELKKSQIEELLNNANWDEFFRLIFTRNNVEVYINTDGDVDVAGYGELNHDYVLVSFRTDIIDEEADIDKFLNDNSRIDDEGKYICDDGNGYHKEYTTWEEFVDEELIICNAVKDEKSELIERCLEQFSSRPEGWENVIPSYLSNEIHTTFFQYCIGNPTTKTAQCAFDWIGEYVTMKDIDIAVSDTMPDEFDLTDSDRWDGWIEWIDDDDAESWTRYYLKNLSTEAIVDILNETNADYVYDNEGDTIYSCKNNGQFHKGEMSGVPGWATYPAKRSRGEAIANIAFEEKHNHLDARLAKA